MTLNDLEGQVLIRLQRQGQLLEQPHRQQPDLQLRQRLAQAHPLTAPIGSKVSVVSSTRCRCRRKSRQVADRLAAANEYGPLPQQAGFVDIASEQEGDGEAHQGQSGQTGGGKNREGLDQRLLQHGQNLEQSLRTAIIPACYRCNPSWQGGPASES